MLPVRAQANGIWGQAAGVIYRFREGAAARVETSCAEPFVFLGEVVDLPEPSRLRRMLPEALRDIPVPVRG